MLENMKVVESKVENLSENEAANYKDEVFEYATFSKGDSWHTCK